jgi:tetratricopeptide (TPR) repeat protein
MRWLVAAAAAALLVTALRAEDAPPAAAPSKDAPPTAVPPGTDAPPAPAPAKSAPRQPMKHKPDVVAGDAPRVDLEVDPRCGVAIVAVTVNGTAGRFVLATGASDTIVTPDFAAKVGIDRTASAARATTSDGSKQAKITRVQSLKVGTTDFKDFDVGILALDELMNHLERPADGVLGANVVLALPVTLDYVGKRLVFGRPTDLSGRKELAAEVSGQRLVVQGTVDGEKTEFVVDTAANYSALAKSAWRGKIQQAQTVDFAVPQEVTLGGVAFQNMAFALADRGVLGLAFFQRGEVVFDAENKKVYVTAEALTQTGPVGALTLRGQAPPPPPEPPPVPVKPLPPALEKQVADLQARLMAIQDEAFRVVIGIVQVQQKAVEALGMTAEKAAEELQRRNTKPLRDYKATLTALVPPLQALDGRFVAILRQIHAAEVDRRNADARPRLAALIDRGLMQRKNVQDKIADLWEKAGDYKAALAVYEAECQVLVERQRTADLRAVKEKMAEAYDKAHESAMALSIYKGLYDAVPPNERGQNVDLMFHLAYMYEKTGDLRNALDIYREAVKNLPPGAKVPGLAEKIASLESRAGSAPAPSSGSSPRGR